MRKNYLNSFIQRGFKLILPVFITLSSFAQETTKVTGKIIESTSKNPLAAATIQIKGTTNKVASGNLGQFEIITSRKVPFSIIVSFIGYDPQEVLITNNNAITVELQNTSSQLSDVVVVGYGTQKKSDITSAIASVPVAGIKQNPVPSIDKVLQGQVSGVQVTQTTGQPGGAVNVRIRGANSITAGQDPLYVIDGFPFYNNNFDANAGGLVTGSALLNPIAFLNPGDIESINILKDASATAIYGSRGANGVVIITTKKAKAGERSVSYDGYYGVQKITRLLPLLDAQDWARLKNDALATHLGAPAAGSHVFTDAEIAALGKGTDWQAAAYRTAPTQSHQITILNGDEKTRFGISASYLNQQGVVINTGLQRFTGRINVESKISKKFITGASIYGSNSSTDVAPGGVTTSVLFIPPTVPIYDSTGAYTLKSPYESAVANPIATLKETTNRNILNRLLGTLYGEYEIITGLKAKIYVGADIQSNKQNSYIPSTLFEGLGSNGTAVIGTQSTKSWVNENTLTYTNTLDKHSFTILAGFTQQQFISESVIAGAQSFINNITTYNNLGSGNTHTSTSNYTDGALRSYLGRINYDFNKKYYATVTVRADAYSGFGDNNKWGYFPSASLAWYVSRENFLKSVSAISNLKVRLSAGQTGNNQIGQYKSLSNLSTSQAVIGGNVITGYAPQNIPNPNLGWEKTTQYDGGVDFDLFRGRVNVVFDAYYKRTTDLLLDFPVPYSTGFNTSIQNTGSIENRGIEIAVNTDNIRSASFKWYSTLLFSLNRNKVLSIGGGRDSYFPAIEEGFSPVIVQVGQPLGSFYGYVTDGIFKSTDDIAHTPRLDQANTKPGDQRYKDLNGDGIISQAGDRAIIGTAQPKFQLGFTNNFSYANFDLSVFFQGSLGNKIYSSIKQSLLLTTGYQNALQEVNNRWTTTNENGTVVRANENVPTTPISDRFIEDGSYLRLKSLTFGYNFPQTFASRLKIQRVRLYVSAQNLVTWTKYTGYDPEVNYYTNNTAPGVDYSTYPNAKTFTGGISVTF
ncbi:MAG: TonB-dependent receptor [Agriterribacter sp.]